MGRGDGCMGRGDGCMCPGDGCTPTLSSALTEGVDLLMGEGCIWLYLVLGLPDAGLENLDRSLWTWKRDKHIYRIHANLNDILTPLIYHKAKKKNGHVSVSFLEK